MKKYICSAFAVALSITAFSSFAATNPSNKELKMMDTNGDGIVSKDEYMAYQERAFDNLKQVDGGGISVKSMRSSTKKDSNNSASDDSNNSSLNDKPIGTTTGRSDVNPKDATNGKKY